MFRKLWKIHPALRILLAWMPGAVILDRPFGACAEPWIFQMRRVRYTGGLASLMVRGRS
jgi:hypothetical protein